MKEPNLEILRGPNHSALSIIIGEFSLTFTHLECAFRQETKRICSYPPFYELKKLGDFIGKIKDNYDTPAVSFLFDTEILDEGWVVDFRRACIRVLHLTYEAEGIEAEYTFEFEDGEFWQPAIDAILETVPIIQERATLILN